MSTQTNGFGVFRNDTGVAPASFDVISNPEFLGRRHCTRGTLAVQSLALAEFAKLG
jgi:hypothetical protein